MILWVKLGSEVVTHGLAAVQRLLPSFAAFSQVWRHKWQLNNGHQESLQSRQWWGSSALTNNRPRDSRSALLNVELCKFLTSQSCGCCILSDSAFVFLSKHSHCSLLNQYQYNLSWLLSRAVSSTPLLFSCRAMNAKLRWCITFEMWGRCHRSLILLLLDCTWVVNVHACTYVVFGNWPDAWLWTGRFCNAEMLETLAEDVIYKILDLTDVATRANLILVNKFFKKLASVNWRLLALTSQRDDSHVVGCLHSVAACNSQSMTSITIKRSWDCDFRRKFPPGRSAIQTGAQILGCLPSLTIIEFPRGDVSSGVWAVCRNLSTCFIALLWPFWSYSLTWFDALQEFRNFSISKSLCSGQGIGCLWRPIIWPFRI